MSTSSPSPAASSDSGLGQNMIIIICASGGALFIGIVVLAVCLTSRKRRKQQSSSVADNTMTLDPNSIVFMQLRTSDGTNPSQFAGTTNDGTMTERYVKVDRQQPVKKSLNYRDVTRNGRRITATSVSSGTSERSDGSKSVGHAAYQNAPPMPRAPNPHAAPKPQRTATAAQIASLSQFPSSYPAPLPVPLESNGQPVSHPPSQVTHVPTQSPSTDRPIPYSTDRPTSYSMPHPAPPPTQAAIKAAAPDRPTSYSMPHPEPAVTFVPPTRISSVEQLSRFKEIAPRPSVSTPQLRHHSSMDVRAPPLRHQSSVDVRNILTRPPTSWNADEVVVWLRAKKVSDALITILQRYQITGNTLLQLDAIQLNRMGISPMVVDSVHLIGEVQNLKAYWSM
ncbi:hypothetical protein HDU97_007250 [Phlyctochytrium planicorne]|nr:hypothetical protein HDU97_007250 [Phlyctochytrium planicorne]